MRLMMGEPLKGDEVATGPMTSERVLELNP